MEQILPAIDQAAEVHIAFDEAKFVQELQQLKAGARGIQLRVGEMFNKRAAEIGYQWLSGMDARELSQVAKRLELQRLAALAGYEWASVVNYRRMYVNPDAAIKQAVRLEQRGKERIASGERSRMYRTRSDLITDTAAAARVTLLKDMLEIITEPEATKETLAEFIQEELANVAA
jgi:hypothetical protein